MDEPRPAVSALNRTLRRLRATRAREEPELFRYDPAYSSPPAGTRYMTLAEARALECNLCGQCCGSADADLPSGDLTDYTFGGIPEHQWAHLNGGQPLVIPLTRTGRTRPWRESDTAVETAPAFQCQALVHVADGTTRCTLWQSRRPPPCDSFPVNAATYPQDVRGGAYILLNTKYQRLCTWVDVLVCPDDSVILGWRRADGTLRARLTPAQQAYVRDVFADAYRDAYPAEGMLSLREWRAIRRAEEQWRPA